MFTLILLATIKRVALRVLVKLILLILLAMNIAIFGANNVSVNKLIIILTLNVNF